MLRMYMSSVFRNIIYQATLHKFQNIMNHTEHKNKIRRVNDPQESFLLFEYSSAKSLHFSDDPYTPLVFPAFVGSNFFYVPKIGDISVIGVSRLPFTIMIY